VPVVTHRARERQGVVVEGVPPGTVTFVFSDVEGSTRLWAADAEAMRSVICRSG
jgi:class 3 adenylate cyclase